MNKPLGLYLHIPFCTRKCYYCTFFSVTPKAELYRLFMRGLRRELDFFKQFEFTFDTFFVGGGTPTSISYKMLEDTIKVVKKEFTIKNLKEFTVEVNPESLTDNHIAIFKDLGINRISIGAQSFKEEELRMLGRPHQVKDIYEAFYKLREAGFKNINIDIMFGFKGQTLKSLSHTLEKVIELAPEHISTYSLSYEDGALRDLRLNDEHVVTSMFVLNKTLLENSGYIRYEISNYAKPGFESIHNLKYWMHDFYIGLGPSASGYYQKRQDLLRYKNAKSLENYARMEREYEKLSPEAWLLEEIFLKTRTRWGLEIDDEKTRRRIEKELGEYVVLKGRKVILNEKGLLLHDAITLKIGEIYESTGKQICV